MGGFIGMQFAPEQTHQQQQPVSGKGLAQSYQPMPTYNENAPKFHNPVYGNLVSSNGYAPTTDMLKQLNAIGRPAYLMNHHQDQIADAEKSGALAKQLRDRVLAEESDKKQQQPQTVSIEEFNALKDQFNSLNDSYNSRNQNQYFG